MAGFAAGFGPAFSRSFEGARERAATERRDRFRLMYEDFISQRNKKEEWEREDGKYAKKAKALTEGAAVNPAVYAKVYEWVKAGLDDSEIEHRLQTGQFDIGEEVPRPEAPQSPESPDKQMQDSGMVEPPAVDTRPMSSQEGASAQPISSVEEDRGGFGGFLSGLAKRAKEGKKRGDERRQQRAYDDVAKAAGVSPDDVRSTISNRTPGSSGPDASNIKFTPGAPERKPDPFTQGSEIFIELKQAEESGDQARIKVARDRVLAYNAWRMHEARMKKSEAGGISGLGGTPVTLWENGEYVTNLLVREDPEGNGVIDVQTGQIIPYENVREVSERAQTLMDRLASSLGKDVKVLNDRKNNIRSTLRTAAKMSQIIKDTNGQVLAGGTAALSRTAQKWVLEASTLANQVNQALGQGQNVAPQYIKQLEQYSEKLAAGEGGIDLATQRSLFETQQALMSFYLGAAIGQEGSKLSDKDRAALLQMSEAGVTVDRFHQAMANIIIDNVRSLDDLGVDVVNNNTDLRLFVDDPEGGYIPKMVEFQPLEVELDHMDKGSDIYTIWETLKQFDTAVGDDIIAPPRPDLGKPDPAKPISTSEEDIPVMNSPEEAMKLPSGTKFKTPDGRVKVRP